MPARPSRRTVVAAALAVPVAAGCTLSGPAPERSPVRRSTEVDPDVALLEEVAASTEALVTLYEAVVGRHRGLRRDLRPVLDAHRAHAAALGDAAPRRGSARRRRRRRGGQGDGPVDVPAQESRAVRRLAGAERQAASDLLDATRRAASGAFARMLASMSASSAQAVRVLGEVGGR
ncbi:MAG TPA: hypothetical protein VHG70_07140 [Nocardioidaceae bacterium]|nr:hypothetical protein [Nocardioidaceae bacterium]